MKIAECQKIQAALVRSGMVIVNSHRHSLSGGLRQRMSSARLSLPKEQTASDSRARLGSRFTPRRRGAIAVELIVSVPILVIMLLAVIEFALIFVSMKQLTFASRLGAKVASEAGSIPALNTLVSSGTLRDVINRQLQAAGSPGACQVIVQYGSGNSYTTVDDVGPTPCECFASFFDGPTRGTFVRVEVGAFLTDFTPNLLGPFGFSIAGQKVSATSTYRLEL